MSGNLDDDDVLRLGSLFGDQIGPSSFQLLLMVVVGGGRNERIVASLGCTLVAIGSGSL